MSDLPVPNEGSCFWVQASVSRYQSSNTLPLALGTVGSAPKDRDEDPDGLQKRSKKGHGIDSIAVDGDKLVVTGVGVDSVKLVKSLRKKIGCTQIVTVSEVKKDKEEKPPTIPYLYSYSYSHLPPMYVMSDAPAPDHPCSIM
ncbi:hypothetical protein ACMD2_25687, partial [Ananas comosus]